MGRDCHPQKGRPRYANYRLSATRCKSGGYLIFYAAGGARDAVCENTKSAAGTSSWGSGKDATGFSIVADGATTSCAGAWWPRWQYGQCASSLGPLWFQSLTTPVAKTTSTSSASETPSIRTVFRTVTLAMPGQEIQTPVIVT